MSKIQPRHHDSSARLPAELIDYVRQRRRTSAELQLCAELRCGVATLEKVIAGEPLTVRSRNRLEARIRELMAADAPTTCATEPPARVHVRMVEIHAEGDAATVGAALGAALGMVGS